MVCGPPAAGKSTLCQQLCDHFACDEHANVSVEHWCYDSIHDSSCQFQTGDTWKYSRRLTIEKLRAKLKLQPTGFARRVILLDDNFSHASMRKEIVHVAKDVVEAYQMRLQLKCLFLYTPLATCHSRNNNRCECERVSESSFTNVVSAITKPGTGCDTIAARSVLVVDGSCKINLESVVSFILCNDTCFDIQLPATVTSQPLSHRQHLEVATRRVLSEFIAGHRDIIVGDPSLAKLLNEHRKEFVRKNSPHDIDKARISLLALLESFLGSYSRVNQ